MPAWFLLNPRGKDNEKELTKQAPVQLQDIHFCEPHRLDGISGSIQLEDKMKKFTKFQSLLLGTALLALSLSACAPAGSGSAGFPTGRFVSASDKTQEYEFNADNTWSYYLGGLMAAKGTFQVKDNLWIEQGTAECPFTGSYQWTYSNKKLSFTVQGDDTCAPRKEATDGQTFVLSQ